MGIMTSHLIFSLYYGSLLPPNAPGVGEGLRGVLWIWVIVGVVGVRSRWVGGGDPPRKLKFDECWMVDWYLRWVDDLIVRSRLCAWMTESVTTIGWEPVTP